MLHRNVQGGIEPCFSGMLEFGTGARRGRSGTTRMIPKGSNLQGGEQNTTLRPETDCSLESIDFLGTQPNTISSMHDAYPTSDRISIVNQS